MSPAEEAKRAAWEATLDRLAEINGMSRTGIDQLVFDARAKIFARYGVTASEKQVLDVVRQVLVAVGARMEGAGLI